MNVGQAFVASMSPLVSLIMILGMLIFAAGFVTTLISMLKTQWSHKSGEGKYITSGVFLLVIGLVLIGVPGF